MTKVETPTRNLTLECPELPLPTRTALPAVNATPSPISQNPQHEAPAPKLQISQSDKGATAIFDNKVHSVSLEKIAPSRLIVVQRVFGDDGIPVATFFSPKVANHKEFVAAMQPILERAFGKKHSDISATAEELFKKLGLKETSVLKPKEDFSLTVNEEQTVATLTQGDAWVRFFRQKGGGVRIQHSAQKEPREPFEVACKNLDNLSGSIRPHLDAAFGELGKVRRTLGAEVEQVFKELELGTGNPLASGRELLTIDQNGNRAILKNGDAWLTLYRLRGGSTVHVRSHVQDEPLKISFLNKAELSLKLTPELDKAFGIRGKDRESLASEVGQVYDALQLGPLPSIVKGAPSRRAAPPSQGATSPPLVSLYGTHAERNSALRYVIQRLEHSGRRPIEDAKELEAAKKSGVLVRLPETAGLKIDRLEIAPQRRFVLPETRTYLETLGRDFAKSFPGESLVLNSAIRESDYNRKISSVDALSPHPYGAAVDIAYWPLSSNQVTWLNDRFSKEEKARTIEAIRERHPAHYHVVVFK